MDTMILVRFFFSVFTVSISCVLVNPQWDKFVFVRASSPVSSQTSEEVLCIMEDVATLSVGFSFRVSRTVVGTANQKISFDNR